jgi:acetolactate synthase-1/2/3 large subunit
LATGDGDIYPNFLKIAEGYGVKAERVTTGDQLAAAYGRMLTDPGEPYLLDVIVEAEENVYPMIPAGGTYIDIIMSSADLAEISGNKQGSNV